MATDWDAITRAALSEVNARFGMGTNMANPTEFAQRGLSSSAPIPSPSFPAQAPQKAPSSLKTGTAIGRLGDDGGFSQGGLIPGQYNPNVGDDTTIPAKIGEYVVPPEVTAVIGKEALDKMVYGIKLALGKNEPPKGMEGQGYAKGGFVGGNDPYPAGDDLSRDPSLGPHPIHQNLAEVGLRTLAAPLYNASDALNGFINGAANTANSLLGGVTGYKFPGTANLDTGATARNAQETGKAWNDAAPKLGMIPSHAQPSPAATAAPQPQKGLAPAPAPKPAAAAAPTPAPAKKAQPTSQKPKVSKPAPKKAEKAAPTTAPANPNEGGPITIVRGTPARDSGGPNDMVGRPLSLEQQWKGLYNNMLNGIGPSTTIGRQELIAANMATQGMNALANGYNSDNQRGWEFGKTDMDAQRYRDENQTKLQENESLDRYRRGELGIRAKELASIDNFRKGELARDQNKGKEDKAVRAYDIALTAKTKWLATDPRRRSAEPPVSDEQLDELYRNAQKSLGMPISAPKPKVETKVLTPEIAGKYYEASGRDRKKAEEAARRDGYSWKQQ